MEEMSGTLSFQLDENVDLLSHVMDQMPTTHIFVVVAFLFCLICGPQCPVCRTLIKNPRESIEPAPFVLQRIISELEFRCCTCIQAIKLHQLPQHQQEGCVPGPPPSNLIQHPTKRRPYIVALWHMFTTQPPNCKISTLRNRTAEGGRRQNFPV